MGRNTTYVKQTLMLAAVVTLVMGCAYAQLDRGMASWQGSHIDAVSAAWGDADVVRASAEGSTYIWMEQKFISLESPHEVRLERPHIRQINCTRELEVDLTGIVVGWRWRGDSCTDPAATGTRFANNAL